MIALLATLAGVFGALIGSFLNVVIYRMPRKMPMGMERSKCPQCDAQIEWYDNVPLLSYVVLLGRCRRCRARIPLRYPLVEALTAAIFALCVFRVLDRGWEPAIPAWVVCAAFASILIAASFIDWDHKILPDKLTKRAGPIVGLLGALVVRGIPSESPFGLDLAGSMAPGAAGLLAGLAGAGVGAGVIWGIRLLGGALLKKEAMGLGDVKFMAMAGLLLGPDHVLLAIVVSLVVGSVLGILIWVITRNKEIPFGPFLAMGSLAVLLYGPEIQHFVLETYPAWIRG